MNPCSCCVHNEGEPYSDNNAKQKPACGGIWFGEKCFSYYTWLKEVTK